METFSVQSSFHEKVEANLTIPRLFTECKRVKREKRVTVISGTNIASLGTKDILESKRETVPLLSFARLSHCPIAVSGQLGITLLDRLLFKEDQLAMKQCNNPKSRAILPSCIDKKLSSF